MKSQSLSRKSLPRESQKIQDIINKKLDEMKEEKEKLERWIQEVESLRSVQSQPGAEEGEDKQTVSDKNKIVGHVLKKKKLETGGEQNMNDSSQDNKEMQENDTEGTEGDDRDKAYILEEELMDTDNSEEIELDNDKSRADSTRDKKRRLEKEEEEIEELQEETAKRRKIVNESAAPRTDSSTQITNLSRDIPRGSRNQSGPFILLHYLYFILFILLHYNTLFYSQ